MQPSVQMGDFIASSLQAKTVEELFGALKSHLAELGFDRLLFSLLTDHPSTGRRAGHGIAANFPSGLVRFYFDNWQALAEPLRRHIASADRAFVWSDLRGQYRLTRTQQAFLQLGMEAGLRDGIVIPLRGPCGALAAICAASSAGIPVRQRMLSVAQMYAQQFYGCSLALERRPDQAVVISLSDQEREVLKWCAAGKTKQEMAIIIGISENAIKCYLRRAQVKLGAANATAAAFLAIQAGVILL